MDLEGELDRLYSLRLDEFTSARNAISKAAKDDGDDAAAKRVKSLKKPSVGAWTLNQLARERADEVAELLSIRDELESAGSPQELRDLAGRRRDLVAKLSKFARSILEESEHGASHATVEKVSQGLLAGGDDEERELLRKGRLTREPSASGLEAFGFAVEADGGEDVTPTVSLKDQREVQKLRREAERLQQESAQLEQEAAFAQEQARRAREKADAAAAAADEAREKADRAAEEAGL
jgi:hypothetical protein